MTDREKRILDNDFFINKQDLAKQIIEFERNGFGFLPNQPETRYIEVGSMQENIILLGRVDKFYFISFSKPDKKNNKYQSFQNKSKIIQFLNANFENIKTKIESQEHSSIDKQKAFWLNQLERIS